MLGRQFCIKIKYVGLNKHVGWKNVRFDTNVQGEWTQTVKSNLDLTERKHAINFNLKVDSDQGRLEI